MANLVITNGDASAELLAAAGHGGTIVPWRDVLHEGPVADLPLAELSAVRAPWLASRFRLEEDDVAADFRERDRIVATCGDFERIELWFEHDLYDQLQLLQALTALADGGAGERMVLVQAHDYLGRQAPDTILGLSSDARAVDHDDVALARRAWTAVTRPTPEPVAEAAGWPDADRLPFLLPALERFLAELPAPGSGLGLTEQRLVAALADDEATGGALFRAALAAETAAFMGDLSFFLLILDLAQGPRPLLTGVEGVDDVPEARVALTDDGRAVAAGLEDRLNLTPPDRWWGGTRLSGSDVWRYDRDAGALVPPAGG